MAWSTPKTDWASTDYFNISDYARIVGNLKYIQSLASEMYAEITLDELADTKTYTDFLYADEMNSIEHNLESLNNGTYAFDIGTTQTYSANGATPLYSEFNRIESATLKIKTTLEVQKENIPTLSFTLGNYRGLRL